MVATRRVFVAGNPCDLRVFDTRRVATWNLWFFRLVILATNVVTLGHVPAFSAEETIVNWCRSSRRNNVAPFNGEFHVGAVKWQQKTEMHGGGSPVGSGGRIFVGTNLETNNVNIPVLLALDMNSGRVLWSHRTRYPTAAEAFNACPDDGRAGVCSSPVVVGQRVCYLAPDGVVYCLDADGFYDHQDDGLKESNHDMSNADVVFRFDLKSLGVRAYRVWASSLATDGHLLYVATNPGSYNRARPDCPSFVALDMESGRLVWQEKTQSTHGTQYQFSSPAVGMIGGRRQVIYAGGDGWLYGFDADAMARGNTNVLWRFDACDGEGVKRTNIMASPVIHGNKVIIGTASARPFDNLRGGVLWCIDASKRGILGSPGGQSNSEPGESGVVWKVNFENEILGNAVVKDDLVFVVDAGGILVCMREADGTVVWSHDLEEQVWGTPLCIGKHLFVAGSDGTVSRFGVSTRKSLPIVTKVGGQAYSTPAFIDGNLVVAFTRSLTSLGPSE